jgi:hypothetical protein
MLRHVAETRVGLPVEILSVGPDGGRTIRESPDRRPQKLGRAVLDARALLQRLQVSAMTREEVTAELREHRAKLRAINLKGVNEYLASHPIEGVAEPSPMLTGGPNRDSGDGERVMKSVLQAYGATREKEWQV